MSLTPAEVELGVPVVEPLSFATSDEAMLWFDAEHTALLTVQEVAAERGEHRVAWLIARALTPYHRRRGWLTADVAVWETALAGIDLMESLTEQALTHRRLGYAYAEVGQHEKAIDHLATALRLADESGDGMARGDTLRVLGVVWERHGDYAEALRNARLALETYRSIGNLRWEADSLNQVGWYTAQLGDHETAREICENALLFHEKSGDRQALADALDTLGFIAQRTGRLREAKERRHQALAVYEEIGHLYLAASTYEDLGDLYSEMGDHLTARDQWQLALEHFEEQERHEAVERVRGKLGQLP